MVKTPKSAASTGYEGAVKTIKAMSTKTFRNKLVLLGIVKKNGKLTRTYSKTG